MIFFPLVLFGIALYFTKWRVWSGVIFFFFLSRGFQFVPTSLFETGLFVSKAPDFALIYILAICVIGGFYYKDFFVRSKVVVGILLFVIFVFVSIIYSRFYLQVTWEDIIRTSRYFFFVLAYFVFRRFSKEDVLNMFRVLFLITLVGCSLYVIQAVTGYPLLVGGWHGKFGTLNRYYNIPILFYVLIIYTFFLNPFKGFWKYYSIVVFCLVAILSQHRGLMIAIFIAAFYGVYVLEGGLKGIFKYLFIGCLALLPIVDVLMERFSDNTSSDIDSVMDGAFTEYSGVMSADGTFLFRIALFYERFDYVLEKPERMLLGVGLMAEGSERAQQEFNFFVGLSTKDGSLIQLDTSDIAWVPFLLRLGFVGTFIYLGLYFFLGKFFYMYRKDKLMLVSLCYIILLLVNSVSSVELSDTQMIVPLLIAFACKENELRLDSDTNINK